MANSSSHVLAAFLGGALIGGIAALLLAPKSGKELREELTSLAEQEAQRCRCRRHASEQSTKNEEETV